MEPVKPLAIGEMLELLAAQPDPEAGYALGFESLRLFIDGADKDATALITHYMKAFPGRTIEEAAQAFRAAGFWIAFMMRAIKPADTETEPEEK